MSDSDSEDSPITLFAATHAPRFRSTQLHSEDVKCLARFAHAISHHLLPLRKWMLFAGQSPSLATNLAIGGVPCERGVAAEDIFRQLVRNEGCLSLQFTVVVVLEESMKPFNFRLRVDPSAVRSLAYRKAKLLLRYFPNIIQTGDLQCRFEKAVRRCRNGEVMLFFDYVQPERIWFPSHRGPLLCVERFCGLYY